MWKIVFLDTETMGNVPNIKKLSELGEVNFYPLTSPSECYKRVTNADIIITCKVVINRDVINAAPNLKMICAAATGVNHIDVAYAQEKGIVVTNVPDYATESVAQHTIALLLAMTNKVLYYDSFIKNGFYTQHHMFTCFDKTIIELKGKIFGIIGLGNIGKRVAKLVQAFGCEVWFYSTSGKNDCKEYKRTSLEDILEHAFFISVHCPLNELTKNLLNKERLLKMKAKYLINTSRGGVVDEYTLAYLIENNLIEGVATDVFSVEPIQSNNPLLLVKNKDKLVLSPHVAWTSEEARITLIEVIIQNISNFIHNYSE